MWFNILFIIYLGQNCNGMLVKSWGTSNKINWLRWSVNDIFNEALELMTLGQNGVYPVQGFIQNLTTNEGKLVQFETYNGWLEDLKLEDINSPSADLRRVVMTRAERYLHEKAAGIKEKSKDGRREADHKHEMIICMECMALTAKSFNYAYRTEMNSTEESVSDPILLWTAGTLKNPQYITLPITFQMSIMINQINSANPEEAANSTHQTNKKQCTILLEPLQINSWAKWWPLDITRISRFSFLADHVETWLETNFNNIIMKQLRSALDTSVRRILYTRNVCLEILLKDSDYVRD